MGRHDKIGGSIYLYPQARSAGPVSQMYLFARYHKTIRFAGVISAALLWVGIRKGFAAYDGGKRRGKAGQTLYNTMKYVILLGVVLTVLQIYHINV